MTEALATIDWLIIAGYLLLSLAIGVLYSKRASLSKEQFFLSGRSLPWWLLGTSMAATNFAVDAPLAITGLVAKQGIAGVWLKWCYIIMWSLAIFFFARLWRRATVITDAEVVELRYSGKPARALRLVKGVYFGVLINCFVMGWVMVAISKIMSAVLGWDRLWTMLIFSAITLLYTVLSGFWGVVVTDLFQYVLASAASVLLAVLAVKHVGGMAVLKDAVAASHGPRVLDFLPSFGAGAHGAGDNAATLAGSTFLVYVLIQWWAQKYSDGGGKHIQRMSSARDERQAMLGTLWFAIATYAFQMWPWIVTAIVSLVLFPSLADPEIGYALAMVEVLPQGLLGLALISLIAAFMSTIDTHLNLGSSYLVNDIYERFIHPGASPKHYVSASRVGIVVLLGFACAIAWQMESVAEAWKFVITFTAGAGPTFVVRWLWWRANAWTEISGMVASGIVASYLQLAHSDLGHAGIMIITTFASAVVWISVTLLTPPVAEETLIRFYERVVPATPWWGPIRRQANPKHAPLEFRAIVLQFVFGAAGLYLLNFGTGYCIFRSPVLGATMIFAGVIIFVLLVRYASRESAAHPAKNTDSLHSAHS